MGVHLWDLALTVVYPSNTSLSTNVESLVQCADIFTNTYAKTSGGIIGIQTAKQASRRSPRECLAWVQPYTNCFNRIERQELLFA